MQNEQGGCGWSWARLGRSLSLGLPVLVTSALAVAAAPPGLPGVSGPAVRPEVLAPGFINTAVGTRDAALSPDGQEFYFTMMAPGYAQAAILVTRRGPGGWTLPEVAPFSGSLDHVDLAPFIAPDGRRFFFTSTRASGERPAGNQDLWVMDRVADGWGEPRPVGAPVNTAASEFFPAVTAGGTLYFTRADSTGRVNSIWRAAPAGDGFAEPERLPDAVNLGTNRFNATVTPAGDRLVLSVVGGPENLGTVDYYLLRRTPDDQWSRPVNLGPAVNDGSVGGWSAAFTPDGDDLLFTSARVVGAAERWPLAWSDLQADHLRVGGGNPVVMRLSTSSLDSLERGHPIPDGPPAAVPAPGRPPAFPELSGPYLGQEPPGLEPRLFAPGIVSTGLDERDVLFSADGQVLWYGVMKGGLVTVMETRLVAGRWTEPVTAPFHRQREFFCFEPTLSADGQSLLLLSNQAAPGQVQGRRWANQNLVRVARRGDGWTDAVALEAPVTTDQAEYFPSLAADGTLYFSREDAEGHPSVWRAEPAPGASPGRYLAPERLPAEVNVGLDNFNATVAADESWLVLCVGGHPDNRGESDYWLATRDAAGTWQPARNLGPLFNGPGWRASSLSVSPDGAFVFFASNRGTAEEFFPTGKVTRTGLLARHSRPGNGSLDIWWVASEGLGLGSN